MSNIQGGCILTCKAKRRDDFKMGEYICRKCGATLDPGEKCRCEFPSVNQSGNARSTSKKVGEKIVRFEERDGKMYAITR